MNFQLSSSFEPTGDQPRAIQELKDGLLRGDSAQVLLGVTGSGKTFTMANVVNQINKPTLILSHNKTLAAQLYGEFKEFFPDNAVEYFVSYYDYYQPEAYIPSSNTYIEKDLSINDEIEKLRLRATSALLSGRKDVLIVSSVSCIYGIGNPQDFDESVIQLKVGQTISQREFMLKLVNSLYSRNEIEFSRGKFRVKGDTIDVYIAYGDIAYRFIFFGDELEKISSISPDNGQEIENLQEISIYPANIFVTSPQRIQEAIKSIQLDLGKQIDYFKEVGKHLEAKRLEDRVVYDLEMMKELGYCSGIENYSRYFDGRDVGSRPFCLLDYFPKDFLMVIDESHVTVSQIKAMYGGDRSRKVNLVDYGFRLPSALDNRPLKFEEFEALCPQTIYMSATPADYELEKAGGVVVEQLIRPTGLLDPPIEVKPTKNQVDDLLDEMEKAIAKNGKILVTTITKKQAEELSKYLINTGVKSRYIHSDIDTFERVEILQDLRSGAIDVIVGVNLLREGIDLPEVSLVAVLDADKEGFLRSARSLTQTAGRAARNPTSKVIFYGDKITPAMEQTIRETARRREYQMQYNQDHGITPTPLVKKLNESLAKARGIDARAYSLQNADIPQAAEPIYQYGNKKEVEKRIEQVQRFMDIAAKELDFIQADQWLSELNQLFELKNKY